MAKMTNLEMVTDILNDLDAEDVAAIGDTEESTQVFKILQSTYFGLIADRDTPEHKDLFTLVETDATTPTVMTLPSTVLRVDWVQMDVRTSEAAGVARRYVEIEWVEPDEFIIRTRDRNDTDTTVDILDDATYTGGTELFLRNDRAPEFYTSFDDENLIFDGYNIALDAFLQTDKSQAYGVLEPAWDSTDGGTQDLDADQFPLFLSIAKNRCFAALKTVSNPKEERWERKLQVKHQKNQHRTKNLKRQTNFGRTSPRQGASTLSQRRND